MARSRNIKPGFFTNEDLVELDFATRLLFAGLWTVADREGRLQDRPKKIKIDVFPADNLDIDAMLTALHNGKFITRYEIEGSKFIQISNWSKHQNPHHTEKASEIPGLDGDLTVKERLEPVTKPDKDGECLADSLLLIPDSLIPDSLSVPQDKPAKRKTRLPENFEPNQTGIDMATKAGLSAAAELVKFVNHHTAKGSLFVDWQSAFRTWIDKAQSFAPRAQPTGETPYQKSMRERVAEFSPDIARKAPDYSKPFIQEVQDVIAITGH